MQILCPNHCEVTVRTQMTNHSNVNTNVVMWRYVEGFDFVVMKIPTVIFAPAHLLFPVGALLHYRESPSDAWAIIGTIQESVETRNPVVATDSRFQLLGALKRPSMRPSRTSKQRLPLLV